MLGHGHGTAKINIKIINIKTINIKECIKINIQINIK